MIIRKIPKYSFNTSKNSTGEIVRGSFYIKLFDLPVSFDTEKVIFSVPNALEIRAVRRSVDDDIDEKEMLSLRREEVFRFNDKDEWLIEAEMIMETEDKTANGSFFMRLPMSAPFMKSGELGLLYDGVWIRFLINGEMVHQQMGLDRFCEPEGDVFGNAELFAVSDISVSYREEKTDASAEFYFPYGYNASIGDVMSFCHNGRYHLMFLLDRMHHGAGSGGSHYICQLTTENLIDWYEQEPIAEITKSWMTLGTGTMVFHNGKYYMSYGLHTERYKGKTEIIEPKEDETNTFEVLSFDEIFEKGGLPGGMTYSVSDDGIHFKPSGILLNAARNPSAYTDVDGKVLVYCGYGADGVYVADSFDGPLTKVENSINFQNDSIMGNTNECPAMFSWNGYKYILVGFTGYFRTLSTDSDSFVDAGRLGEDIYDGLNVPMVAELPGNRRIVAGWVRHPLGWGGFLSQRELVFQDGKLGMKWVPELMPRLLGENLATDKDIKLQKKKSYYLSFDIDPEETKNICVSFGDGEKGVSVRLDRERRRLTVNDSEKNKIPPEFETVLEQMKKITTTPRWYRGDTDGNIAVNAVNYTISDIEGTDKPFKLRLKIRYSERIRGTVIDGEIAGVRTFITVREGFFPDSVSVFADGSLKAENKELYEIETIE